jgi:hypothetical protein
MIAICPIARISPGLRHALSLLGLGIILGSLLLVSRHVPFPGWVAFFPCLGAGLLVICSLAGKGIGNTLLSHPSTVFVGRLSYSLYLWHWPPRVFAQHVLFRHPTGGEAALLIAFSSACAFMSWRYVEQPFRGLRSRIDLQSLVRLMGGAAAVHCMAAALLIGTRGMPGRLNANALAFLSSEDSAIPADCFGRSPQDVTAGRTCHVGARGTAASFVIWGDSHASRMAITLDAVGRRSAISGGSRQPALARRFNGCSGEGTRSAALNSTTPSSASSRVTAPRWSPQCHLGQLR